MDKPKDYSYEEFHAKWPRMFRDVYCGFGLPKGWGPLVWNLCKLIDHHVNGNPHVWEYKDVKAPDPSVVQVKEKFGGLRFYCHGTDDKIKGYIEMTEYLSHELCQECGTNQNVNKNSEGWRRAMCPPCRKEFYKKLE